ncbi:hypothetical protein Tco_0562714 [Tanacetum coccineum]
MASNQAINYAPQCGDLTVESLVFNSNNVVGNFSYLKSAPSYHDICKYLINCPLAEAITKSPSLVYQNLLREFWCTATAYDPNPPINDSEARPLKEYIIKFSVKNGLRFKISNEGAAKTTSFLEGPHREKYLEGVKPPPDMELLTHPYPSGLMMLRELDNQPLILSTIANVQALLQSDDESDNNVLRAGEEMDEDIPPTDKEAQSSPPNQEQPESSHAQESGSDSCPEALKKFDIILPLTERQLVKYIQKLSQAIYDRLSADSWDKDKEAVVSMLISGHPLKAIKEDHALNKKVLEATKAFTANSNNITKLLSLTKTFDFSGLKSLVESMKLLLILKMLTWKLGPKGYFGDKKYDDRNLSGFQRSVFHPSSSVLQSTLAITEGPANVRGENVTLAVTEEPPSHIEGENAYMDTDKAAEKESNTQNLELIQVHIIKQPMKSSRF